MVRCFIWIQLVFGVEFPFNVDIRKWYPQVIAHSSEPGAHVKSVRWLSIAIKMESLLFPGPSLVFGCRHETHELEIISNGRRGHTCSLPLRKAGRQVYLIFFYQCCSLGQVNDEATAEQRLNIYAQRSAVAKLSIATGHAMQIYNCPGQLRQFATGALWSKFHALRSKQFTDTIKFLAYIQLFS